MLSDLKFALRLLQKAPILSAVIVLSLAAGIGANTVVFSWIQAAFLDPLPGVERGASLMVIAPRDRSGNHVDESWPVYCDLRAQQSAFREIAATRIRPLNLGATDAPDERVWAELVSDNFFALLRLRPALGRFFTADEATRPGAAPVAVIAHSFWRARFAGNPAVLGQTLRLNDRGFTIIGVAPEQFKGSIVGLGLDVWVPFTMSGELVPSSRELADRGDRSVILLADPRPGVAPAQAAADLAAFYRQMGRAFPDSHAGMTADLLPLWRSPSGAQRYMIIALGTLQALVLLVLLVVCANAANLMLARATVRQKEIGIRLAIGAGRLRIVRQLLIESVLLALLGAAGGVLLSLWGIDALYRMPMTLNLPVKMVAHIDGTTLAFSLLLGAACGLVFGLAPALHLAGSNVGATLKTGGRGPGPATPHRLRDVLVGVEVALAVVVLVLAGLFLKSFRNSQTTDPGFNPRNVLLAQFDLGAKGYDKANARAFVRDLLPRLRALPGVEMAATAGFVPLDFRGLAPSRYAVDGRPVDPAAPDRSLYTVVSPGYLQTVDIPLVAGRDFVDLADTDKPAEVIVNQELARRAWSGLSPLGRRFSMDGQTYEVVGVARDAKYASLSERPTPMAYISLRDRVKLNQTLFLRIHGDPLACAPAVRRAIREFDPYLPVRDVRTLAQHVADNTFMLRVPARLLTVLGPLALLLAAIGIYSVLSYATAQRLPEIGVRLALGATPAEIVTLVVGQGLAVVAAGLAAGLAAAYLISAYLAPSLVNVPAGDPAVILGAALVILAVAALACWLPARHASQVDPIAALRAE